LGGEEIKTDPMELLALDSVSKNGSVAKLDSTAELTTKNSFDFPPVEAKLRCVESVSLTVLLAS